LRQSNHRQGKSNQIKPNQAKSNQIKVKSANPDHGNPRNVGQQPAIHPPISVGFQAISVVSDFFGPNEL